jgi:hypothetical protein
MEIIMSSRKVVAIFVALVMSYIYSGTIHINGYAELPNGDSGTAGSEVRYKNITQNTLPVIGFLDAEGKYSVDLIVDPSGINDTTIGYSARAYGNNIIISGTDVERINVYNTKGQLVKKASFNAKNGITRGSFETGGLSTGLYFINVDTKSKSFTLKTNIFEGQSSLMPDQLSLPASKQGTGKAVKISNDFEVKILAPSGEFAAYTDTLTFSIPDTGVESWENPVHALSYNSPSRILGYVQKGPFITGSSVQIQELNNSLTPNGNTYNVSTEDNFGSFVLETLIPTKYIEVISTGFYFNEISGSLSEANLTLRAIAETDKVLGCNVNILTSLAKKRIVYLVTTEGKTFTEAKIQAQNEILAVFSIDGTGAADFEDMDISESGDSNGMLLAVSAILQGNNTVAELSSLISTIIEDVKTDGILDNLDAKNEIIENAKFLSLISVRKNIEDRYEALGLTAAIPNFEQYINNIWVNQPPTCQITKLECVQTMGTSTSTLSALDGKTLVIGSQAKLELSSEDIDGAVRNYWIYLDDILVDSLCDGTYSWTITDTTKFHSVKAVAFDDDGTPSEPYTKNYELYGSVWEYESTPPFTSAALIGNLNGSIIAYSNEIYSSADCMNWTDIGDVQVLPPGENMFLQEICGNKIWKMNQPYTSMQELYLYSSSDGVNWQNEQIVYPGINSYAIEAGGMFSCNDNPYCILLSLNLGTEGIFKINNDSLFVKYTKNDSIPSLGSNRPKTIKLSETTFLYNFSGNADYNSKVLFTTDGEDWEVGNINLLGSFEGDQFITFENKGIMLREYTGKLYKTDDGLNWFEDELLSPKGDKLRLWIFDNRLWVFDGTKIYSLKKYFD